MKYESEFIGKVIKSEREKNGWTQEKLAKKMGVSNKQISNYEHGYLIPPIENLQRLCELFGCELGYILGEEDYSDHTKLNTTICKKTGLSPEALDAIISLTGNAGLDLEFTRRKVINKLFTDKAFAIFIDRLCELDYYESNYNAITQDLEEKLGKELLDQALDVYSNPQIDPEHDTEYQSEHPDICKAILLLDEKISEMHDIRQSIDMARYHLNKAMELLIDDIYPKSSR